VFAFFSCDRNEVLVKTSTDLGYNVSVDTIQFGSYGGKDTVDIPFENCYLHYVRNNDSVLFFYLMEPDYAVMDSIIEARSIIVEPKEVDPTKGFTYFEWDWFSIELKENKAILSVKENYSGSERTADINLPNRSFEGLEIKISQSN
jgi:hypothetical protein